MVLINHAHKFHILSLFRVGISINDRDNVEVTPPWPICLRIYLWGMKSSLISWTSRPNSPWSWLTKPCELFLGCNWRQIWPGSNPCYIGPLKITHCTPWLCPIWISIIGEIGKEIFFWNCSCKSCKWLRSMHCTQTPPLKVNSRVRNGDFWRWKKCQQQSVQNHSIIHAS